MAFSKNEEMDREICELRYKLKAYRREELYPERLNIGLFGRTGIGKTSLINSLKFAVKGSFRRGMWLSVATLEKAGGHTLHRVIASLTGNISVIDNRGFADLAKDGTLKELEAQMDGKRRFSETVEWENPNGAAADDCINDVHNRQYSIGCAVFVFSARDNISQSTNGLCQVVCFLQARKGRYPMAVITNVDCVDRERVDTLRYILRAEGISNIFEVANITKDKTTLEISYQHSLLCLLYRCMGKTAVASPDILVRWPKARQAYAEAAQAGTKTVFRTRMMLVGFDQNEAITDGEEITNTFEICIDVTIKKKEQGNSNRIGATAAVCGASTSTARKVSNEMVHNLAKHVPTYAYDKFSGKLGIEQNQARNTVVKYQNDYEKATMECIAIWMNKSTRTVADLHEVLRAAELGALTVHCC